VKGYIYIVGSAIFTLYGQLIIKWRIGKFGSIPESINGKINFLFNLFSISFSKEYFVYSINKTFILNSR